MANLKPEFKPINIEAFDKLARNRKFKDGPYQDSFGDGYGEPYRPERRVWGTLKNGDKVESTKHYGADRSEE